MGALRASVAKRERRTDMDDNAPLAEKRKERASLLEDAEISHLKRHLVGVRTPDD
jgi:hypothetical protein